MRANKTEEQVEEQRVGLGAQASGPTTLGPQRPSLPQAGRQEKGQALRTGAALSEEAETGMPWVGATSPYPPTALLEGGRSAVALVVGAMMGRRDPETSGKGRKPRGCSGPYKLDLVCRCFDQRKSSLVAHRREVPDQPGKGRRLKNSSGLNKLLRSGTGSSEGRVPHRMLGAALNPVMVQATPTGGWPVELALWPSRMMPNTGNGSMICWPPRRGIASGKKGAGTTR